MERCGALQGDRVLGFSRRGTLERDKTLVIQDKDKPLAVLLKYEHFLGCKRRR